jgi:hypothetical protein
VTERDALSDFKARYASERRQDEKVRLAKGSGGGDSGGMDQIAALTARVDGFDRRMDRMETKLDQVDTRLRAIETSVAGMSAKVDVLTNQIVGRLPTWWQMPAIIASTVVLLTLLYAGAKHFHLFG